MAAFAPAVEKVLRVEGGYQNDSADWGNYNAYDANGNYVEYKKRPGTTTRVGTNRGISAALYSSLKGRAVTVEEIKAITRQQAIEIYRKLYWDKMKGNQFQNQQLAELVFDSYINHGGTGIKLVQQVLNTFGKGLSVDGAIGPMTLAAIHSTPVANLYNRILSTRAEFYKALAAKREGNERFLKGWLNRLKKFPPMGKEVSIGGILFLGTLAAILWSESE